MMEERLFPYMLGMSIVCNHSKYLQVGLFRMVTFFYAALLAKTLKRCYLCIR